MIGHQIFEQWRLHVTYETGETPEFTATEGWEQGEIGQDEHGPCEMGRYHKGT
ncbi:hypothetical protein A8990_12382 [Paenibacillus taihuensis]|uniref:Uncharacterized protein n=1 Tax=Paenibacillus taihuensis TaxID=1156355 RepID=A0A3D9RSK5_9BACL|nr:hypothetical protein [Paenibacillus taihuensis]REE78954.1 hypothetical protein A8990_12382 [Paenibacillus taihuensis]